MGVQCVWCHARSGRQCGPQHAVRGEVAPVRSRERVIVFSCAAEPDIPSMRGKDLRAENGGVSTGETTRQTRSFEQSPTNHGLAAKPSERVSSSKRTAGTIPRLDGNTACTTPDWELNKGSSRTSAPLDKSSLASNAGRRAAPTPRRAARRTL